MNNKARMLAAAEERAANAAIRKRYFDGRKQGLSHEDATKYANSGELDMEDLKAKADHRATGGGSLPRYNARQKTQPPKQTDGESGRTKDEKERDEQPSGTHDPSGVEIPHKWEDLVWPTIRSIASKIRGPEGKPIKNRADAEKVIRVEVNRRARLK